METVTVDRYRRSDGTPVIRHKRRLPHNLRVSKNFFKSENNNEDLNEKKIVYPKRKDNVAIVSGGCGGDFTKGELEEMSECSPEEIAQMKRDVAKSNRDLRLKKRIEKGKGKKNLRGQAKVEVVMKEFKRGKLKSSSGEKVTKRSQAVAIAMSEAGLSKKKYNSIEPYKKSRKRKVAYGSGRYELSRDRETPFTVRKSGRKLTLKKAKAFSKEEKSASKEYKSLGFKKIANDENRHHEFFEKKTKELGKR